MTVRPTQVRLDVALVEASRGPACFARQGCRTGSSSRSDGNSRPVDDGIPYLLPPSRLIEENLWWAIRHGFDGRMIDLQLREEFPAAALPDRLLA